MHVYLLSDSPLKQSVVRELLNDFDIRHVVNAMSIDNIITELKLQKLPAQPINESGLSCAISRINYFKFFMESKNLIDRLQNALIISIENYIETEFYVDKCCVVIEYNNVLCHGISTDDVAHFPKKLLENIGEQVTYNVKYDFHNPEAELCKLVGYDMTIGSYINSIDNTTSANDWMKKYNPRITRRTQIYNAFENLNFISLLSSFMTTTNDFPTKGVVFKDIFPLLSDNFLRIILYNEIMKVINASDKTFDYVVGLESRGFILGPVISDYLNCGFVPIRKVGKLPPPTFKEEYVKEYGKDIAEISQNCIPPNANVLVVDDILATGGSLRVAEKLLEHFKCHSITFFVLSRVDELSDQALQTLGDSYDNVLSLFN